MDIVPAKPPRRPTGNFERDCPADKIQFKKSKVVRFILKEGWCLGSRVLAVECRVHTSAW